jgi:cytochrome c-type biogenesis protein CcmH
MTKRLALQLALPVILGVLLVLPAAAQTTEPTDDQVNAIAKHLYCPVCENVPLDVCPTQACVQWRATIRQMLAEGRSEAEIDQYFVEQYGARVLATPPAVGLNWLVYVIPPLAFAAGGLVLLRAVRSWRRANPSQAPTAVSPEDPYVARLEEELRRRG